MLEKIIEKWQDGDTEQFMELARAESFQERIKKRIQDLLRPTEFCEYQFASDISCY